MTALKKQPIIHNDETSNVVSGALFYDYLKKWEQQTMFCSSVKSITENENFQAIVMMKENAVPFIIQKIKEGPTLLVWALNLIYDKKISENNNVSIEEVGKLWIKELQV
jgi:hypothetical protein